MTDSAPDARFRITRARTELILEHPFFGTVATGLQPKADPECATAWTDGKTLGFNPVYVNALPEKTLQGLLAHLVLHAALKHPARRKDRDPSIWNMACDHTINWVLIEAGFRLPEGYLDDPDYRHLPVETVYECIRNRNRDESGNGTADPGAGDRGDGQEMDGEGADGEKVAGDSETEGEDGSVAPETDDGGDAGSSGDEDGDSDTEETGGGDPGGTGEVRDGENAADGQDPMAGDDTLDAIVARALLASRDEGSLPAEVERLVRDALEPAMDWRLLLSRFIDQTARDDHAWFPPNRRYLHQGLYLPSVKSENCDQIVIVVDTSGSISDRELALFSGEISAILSAFPGEILIMGCDTKVGSVERLSAVDLPFTPNFKGGGGTDFRAPFRFLEHEGITPRCLIYLTDLACSRYPDEPGFPVLWAVCGTDAVTEPEFGEIVRMGVA